MKFTQATDYAVRAVMHLAHLPREAMVEAGEIAQAQSIPVPFLLKIFRTLASVGIVGSQRGPGGGFVLLRDPAEITLLDILEAVEGTTGVSRCLIDAGFCSRHAADYCPIRQTLSSVQKVLTTELARYDIATLASREYKQGDN